MKLGAWYLNAFLHDFIPIYPLYAVMFGEHGVSPYGLSVLLSLWALVALAAEVPSGTLADKYSRKRLLVASGVLKSAAYVVWLAAPGFGGFLAGFVFWGVGGALRSGTLEALLHDSLEEHARADAFAKVYGRMSAVHHLAIGLSMFVGGALIRYGYGLVLLFSAVVPLLASAVVAVGIREVEHRLAVREERYVELLRAGLRETVTNPAVLFVILFSSVLLGIPNMFDEFAGPLLHEKGFPNEWIGYWFGLSFLAAAVGNALGHRVRHLPWPALLAGLSGAGVLMAAAGAGKGWPVAAAIAGFFLLFAVAHPLAMTRLQEAIRGQSRATVTSVNSMAAMVVGVAEVQAFGALAQGYSFGTATTFNGLLILLLAVLFTLLARKAGPVAAAGGTTPQSLPD